MNMIHLAWENLVDDRQTVISASAAVGDLSPQNLRDPRPLKRWRAMTGKEDVWGQCDFGMDTVLDFVALVFPRDTPYPSGSVTHFLKDASGNIVGGDKKDLAHKLSDPCGYHLYFFDEPVVARYWRWTYQVSGLSYVDTGRAWAGRAWRPSTTADAGLEERWLDSSTVQQGGRSASVFVDEGPRLREISFGFSVINRQDIVQHRELQRVVGRSRQMIVWTGKDGSDGVRVLGRLTQERSIRNRSDAAHLYQTSYRIREF